MRTIAYRDVVWRAIVRCAVLCCATVRRTGLGGEPERAPQQMGLSEVHGLPPKCSQGHVVMRVDSSVDFHRRKVPVCQVVPATTMQNRVSMC